jgi:hypothetical protein
MQIWGNATESSAWTGGKKLILNPETLGNFDHMTSNISKGCIYPTLCWERLYVIFLNQNQLEISPKIPLDPVSSKNNVVFKTAVKWMPKNYKNKDRNPNDPNISILTQHTDRIGFSYTLSQENIPTNIPIF